MMRNLSSWVAAAGAAAVLLSTSGAHAQRHHGGWEPMSRGHRLGGELDIWPARNFFVMTSAFVGQIEAVDHLMIDFDLPWAFGSFDGLPRSQDSSFLLGNPSVGAHYGTNVSPGVALWVGGLLTIPTIFDPGLARTAVAGAAASDHAFFWADRYIPEYLTIRPRAGLEIRGVEILYYRADLGLPVYVPVGDRANDAEFIVEQGNEFEIRAPMGIGGGVRLQFAAVATDNFGRADRFQAAMEPYFVYEPVGRKGFFIRAGVFFALDRPLGFGFERNNLATITVAGGGKF